MNKSFKNIWEIDITQKIIKKKRKYIENKGKLLEYSRYHDRNLSGKEIVKESMDKILIWNCSKNKILFFNYIDVT